MSSFQHVVEIDEARRELRIYRLNEAGVRQLYTATPLPKAQGWTPELEDFARQLGENLLLDSPTARKIFAL